MNEKNDFYIAVCRCCLIAEAMKCCSLCQFNIGLTPAMPVDSISLPISLQVVTFAKAE
jgi:hypothetical protein